LELAGIEPTPPAPKGAGYVRLDHSATVGILPLVKSSADAVNFEFQMEDYPGGVELNDTDKPSHFNFLTDVSNTDTTRKGLSFIPNLNRKNTTPTAMKLRHVI
jgi:hypothetical protein